MATVLEVVVETASRRYEVCKDPLLSPVYDLHSGVPETSDLNSLDSHSGSLL